MGNKQIFKGVITALITPQRDGKIDLDAFNGLLNRQFEADIDGIVIAGSTGEGVFLSIEEVDILLKEAFKAASSSGKSTKIIAGVSTASTAEALAKVRAAEKHPIDGLMLTTPYYVKPSCDGIAEHYKILHDNSESPILLYDNPGRTAVALQDSTITRLGSMERIIALKDAGSDMMRPLRLGDSTQLEGFAFLCGNDGDMLSYMANGGEGIVSVLSNIMPRTMKRLFRYIIENERQKSIALQRKIFNISENIFSVTNPVGIKCAHALMGHCSDNMRMPLMPLSDMQSDGIKSIIPLIDGLENEQL